MGPPRILWIGAIAMMASLVSCSTQTNPVAPAAPQETGDGWLSIQDAKVVFSNPRQVEVTATVENHTDRLFYARLGDLYDRANPTMLYAAAGSSGFIEQWDPPSWRSLRLCVAIEGVWVVELRPHSRYTLVGITLDSTPDRAPPPGDPPAFSHVRQADVRLRVQYFDDAAMSADKAHQDFSNTFVLTRPF